MNIIFMGQVNFRFEYFIFNRQLGISGTVYVWETLTGNLIKKFQAHNRPITKILITKFYCIVNNLIGCFC